MRLIVVKRAFVSIVLPLLLLGISSVAHAQPGPSFSARYDFFPYENFDDPEAGLEDAEVRSTAMSFSASYPFVFSQGRTVLVNEIYYQRRDFDYRNFPGADPNINDIHTVNYTLTLQRVLSQKWSVLALVTPGLASDFEADISGDDFNLQAVLLFIRKYSERLSLGFGAAYVTQFGEPFPVPLLTLEWNNGSDLSVSTIIPSSFEFWYRANQKIDLGVLLSGDGNDYHGDPDIYNVDEPRLRYSVFTIGPAARAHLSQWLHLHVEGGFIGFHRSEFFDGNDEQESYDLKPSAYVRAGIRIGG